ncbi:MAG: N-acetyltransferase family protein [Aestuariivirga sp.]
MPILVRSAAIEDSEAIAAIYAHHVLHGTASFDMVPRSLSETQERVATIAAKGWPFLVAEIKGQVVGYAYATQFRDRAAYASTCENSIYVLADERGTGIGSVLLQALIKQSEEFGFRQMIAVIGGGEPASIAVHQKLGFVHAGRMVSVGRKKGRWLDTVYMQLPLGENDSVPPEHEP